ncbi:MAG: polyphosphate kinase 2 family protein [Anaerolineales bacterium]
MSKAYRVRPGTKVRLKDFDPNDTSEFKGDKEEAQQELEKLNTELERLQECLYAEGKHKVLIVLQGMDTSGKDGVIRSVFDGVNPQGVRVACFKVPTPEELAHDYLWRIHKMTPGKGEMVIFNRSHYEDVLVVRVHELVPESVWKKRYDQINAFERTLAEEGTTILKFYLHIDEAEQKQRLLDRLADPSKHWKFNPGDLKERALWGQYIQAYEDALSKTSTDWAPWYIIPANKKWYRNLIIARLLVGTLQSLNIQLPQPLSEIDVERYRLQLLVG